MPPTGIHCIPPHIHLDHIPGSPLTAQPDREILIQPVRLPPPQRHYPPRSSCPRRQQVRRLWLHSVELLQLMVRRLWLHSVELLQLMVELELQSSSVWPVSVLALDGLGLLLRVPAKS